jgi:hypothetical protein
MPSEGHNPRMNNRKKINEELNGMESSLPGDTNPGPFSVPEGYFDNLAGNIMARIQGTELSAREEIQSLSPLLANLDRKMLFSIPQDYFENNLETMPVLTGEDPDSAILKLVEKVTPYEVPFDYFEQLPSSILKRIKPATPVITMKRGWMRMAVAAVFFGIIMVSGFWIIDNQKQKDATVAAQLKNVSNQELDAFIKNRIVLPSSEGAQDATAATEVKNLLIDVADKELENFLNEVPSDELYAIN